MVCFELHNNHKTKGRCMREYTRLQDSAHAQTVDIPAFGGKLDVNRNPESQVTQWGGLAYFVSYLKTSGLFDRLVEDAPFHYTSPNAPDVRDIVGTTVPAIVCGFTRYVHINRLRNDTAPAALLELGRIVRRTRPRGSKASSNSSRTGSADAGIAVRASRTTGNSIRHRLRRSTGIAATARTISTSTRTSTAGADSSRRI